MAKNSTHKRTRHLEGYIKQLEAEIKRLKKQPLDKDEEEYFEDDIAMIPCVHCNTGFMTQLEILDRSYWKCSSCDRTKRNV